MVFLRIQNVLWVFDQVKESDSVCTVAKNSFSFDRFSILQLDGNWLFVGVVLDLTHFGVKSDLGAKRPGTIGKYFRQLSVASFNIAPLSFSIILKFAHDMVKQNVAGIVVGDAQILTDDSVGSQCCF